MAHLPKGQGVFLPPFKAWLASNIPAVYDNTMTYYEELCALIKYLQDVVIPALNHNAEAVTTIATAVEQLQKYVEDYFKNLDVQEEINNKLDEMTTDGTFDAILDRLLIKENMFSPLALKNFHDLVYADSDTFEGYDHGQAQGCVIVGDSIIVALRNFLYHDNYVRLVEYDYKTNTIVRSKYVLLNHANGMTYDEANGIIYVAGCNKVVSEGVIENDNTIFALDYTTLTIQSSFVPTGLPEGGRVRSVTYDNEHHKLYAGDVTSIYEIDIANQTVANTINLETDNVDTTVTNQTFTYYNGKFYGLFITYLGVWDIEGGLVKVLSLPTDNLVHIGEGESIGFTNDSGDFIMVSAKRYNPRQSNRVTSLCFGNIYKGIDNKLATEIGGADTSNITLYVDGSYSGEETGQSDRPFSSIAKAVGCAKQWNKGTDIVIKAGTYDYVYLNQISNIVFNIAEAGVVINGLELRESNLTILNGNRLTINYLYLVQHSNLIASNLTVNQLNGSGYAMRMNDSSSAKLDNCTFTGNDTTDTIYVDGNCILTLRTPTLNGYAGHYAINATSFSEVFSYNPTLGITPSATQYAYRVNAQSIIHVDAREGQSQYLTYIQGQGQKSPSLYKINLENPVYNGEICELHYGFTSAQIVLKVAGTNSSYKDFDIDLLEAQSHGIRIDTAYPNTSGIRVGSVNIQVQNGKLKVTAPKMAFYASDGTYTFEDITDQTGQNYPAVAGVKFFNK